MTTTRAMALSLTALLLSGCATQLPRIPISAEAQSAIRGQRLKIEVRPASSLTMQEGEPNPLVPLFGGAGTSAFGSMSQTARGTKAKELYQLSDPSLEIARRMQAALASKYEVQPGSDYVLEIQTVLWQINDAMGDNSNSIYTLIYISLQLNGPDSRVVASDQCYFNSGPKEPASYFAKNGEMVRADHELAAEMCMTNFSQVLMP